ncbi:PIG-L deacetylase family protein [Luteipulveratus mongoliensis]|uniref:GlcNAc-PI de-N-acetylase n=1 Tax=Luteipulveratus mongoliensis TaxID=571913 RepID=A0A0K1JH65_9MICO|nr:PIG-L family deacetylase [Luteipulveratus mongoliensis]AKU16054.1 GlcNAc-PI de-N-acetylase [Luteipulveratus mongoliensis]
MLHTLVAFHAHPDDEALLTSGTMARAVAEGHRVVLVVATDGELGLASEEFRGDGQLASRRLEELQASARALGVHRVEHLGYADSGMGPELYDDPPSGMRFIRAPVEEAAGRLADILREEDADVLLTYDANGGYGHRDHVRVHEVGARAAEIAQTPRVLQATVPRDLIAGAVKLVAKVYRFPADFDPTSFERSFSASSDITHRVSVRRYIGAKRASMRAHASQASADGGADRTLGMFLKIPRPAYDLIFGREWFVDPTHQGPVSDDIFEGLP